MNKSNYINTLLHVVSFVASQSSFANATNLLFRGSVNYTFYRFTFAALRAYGNEHLRQGRSRVENDSVIRIRAPKKWVAGARIQAHRTVGRCISISIS